MIMFCRSGSFIAVDETLSLAESKRLVHVNGVIKYLIQQRRHLFNTPQQLR